MPEPTPLNPTRHTAEAMRSDTEAMALQLVELMAPTPGAAQWRAAESLALCILSAVRKGATAHQLVLAANSAVTARRQDHQDALVVQMDRMGMRDDLETGQSSGAPEGIHPIFDNLLRSLAPRQVAL